MGVSRGRISYGTCKPRSYPSSLGGHICAQFITLRTFHLHFIFKPRRILLSRGDIENIFPHLLGTRLLQEVLAAQGQIQPTDKSNEAPKFSAPVSTQPAVTSHTPSKKTFRKSPVSRDMIPNNNHISWHQKIPGPVVSNIRPPSGDSSVRAERTRHISDPVIALKEERILVEDCDDNKRFKLSPESSEMSLMKCGQCNQSFAQKNMLQVHVCPHIPRRPYKCNYCSESFSFPNELRTHVVTHASDKPFKCGYCSRTFAGATTLNNHIRTHTGERPFLCEKCGKTFTQASQLSKHQRIPHECAH